MWRTKDGKNVRILDWVLGDRPIVCKCAAPRIPQPETRFDWALYRIGLFLLIGVLLYLGWELERGFWYYRERSENLMTSCLQSTHNFPTCYKSFVE